ncbi:MAG: hypothetical protein NUV56_04945 [Candidatus Uhrbacteria bacterium]|nr:hypothetical protein [Candidatus Uhrbacteria bacterium]
MPPITSVETAKAAFPNLKWRDDQPTVGAIAYAIMGGDRATGDITILLAMEGGACAPVHNHIEREGWPFRETITCLAGSMYGIKQDDAGFVLEAGQSVDLNDSENHAPRVLADGFALVIYRQPAGHKRPALVHGD